MLGVQVPSVTLEILRARGICCGLFLIRHLNGPTQINFLSLHKKFANAASFVRIELAVTRHPLHCAQTFGLLGWIRGGFSVES